MWSEEILEISQTVIYVVLYWKEAAWLKINELDKYFCTLLIVSLVVFSDFWLCTDCAHSDFGSQWMGIPFLSKRCNLICPQPLPSAAAAEFQQLVTSSHSHHLPQKVCLFTKPQQMWHLQCRQVQSLRPSDLGLAMKDESVDWHRCCGARVWMMLSSAVRQTGELGKMTRRAEQGV